MVTGPMNKHAVLKITILLGLIITAVFLFSISTSTPSSSAEGTHQLH